MRIKHRTFFVTKITGINDVYKILVCRVIFLKNCLFISNYVREFRMLSKSTGNFQKKQASDFGNDRRKKEKKQKQTVP